VEPRDRQVCLAAAAVLPAAAGHPRSPAPTTRRSRFDSGLASVKLQLGGCVIGATIGFPDRRLDRLVAKRGYWRNGATHHRAAGDRVAADRLHLPSSWSEHVPDCARQDSHTVLTWSGVASVSSAYCDVARTLGAAVIPGSESCHSRRAAARVRRVVHGAGISFAAVVAE
jgi:hypothetical protein